MNTISERRRARAMDQDLRRLRPIVRQLARKSGSSGFTAQQARRAFENRGWVFGSTDRGYLSSLMKRAVADPKIRPIGYARTIRFGSKGGGVARLWGAA